MSGLDLALTGSYDLSLDSQGDLTGTETLETAVLVSILSDARADASEEPIPERRRGWIGDAPEVSTAGELGSKLWLLHQRRNLSDATVEAEDAVAASLEWMIAEGIVTGVTPELGVGLTGFEGTVALETKNDPAATVLIKAVRATV